MQFLPATPDRDPAGFAVPRATQEAAQHGRFPEEAADRPPLAHRPLAGATQQFHQAHRHDLLGRPLRLRAANAFSCSRRTASTPDRPIKAPNRRWVFNCCRVAGSTTSTGLPCSAWSLPLRIGEFDLGHPGLGEKRACIMPAPEQVRQMEAAAAGGREDRPAAQGGCDAMD